ncbi:MAG TPA: DICT sensory domain-containing protein [Segeticoccus sp.]|uniref:DICT sensory domain-containing protein n=1 Tax=Segeticoccus sp. TaxID=2706531 RepID=UPI002D800429|nr:DICT sensory domain-containing protein [Segeticoccus sp.]HET8601195.1 DICT sensory domain-containing protein [Segeticoccus sp.]
MEHWAEQPTRGRGAEERTINEQGEAGLSIGELSRRTGVPSATLRTWEARYGAPAPLRREGRHRRYAERDVALVEEILRRRDAGLGLAAAFRLTTNSEDAPEPSVFAGLRRHHPGLRPQVLRKPTLLALTRAMEDECCARAQQPVLFASFQRERFYRASAARWQELARTARAVVVFADFARPSARGVAPLEVPVPADAPMRREWALVCDAPDHPAALTGWEVPAEGGIADSQRRFETVWTIDPAAVRDASRIAARLADRYAPGQAGELEQHLAGSPGPASRDVVRAEGLFDRMLGYLESARPG